MSAHAQTSIKTFFGVWVALLVLTALTTTISYVHLGPFNAIVALLIAAIKASLVGYFFMEVRFLPKMTKMVVVSFLFFLGILLTLTMTDFMTRLLGR